MGKDMMTQNLEKFQKNRKKNRTDLKHPPKDASQRDKSNGMQQVPNICTKIRLLAEYVIFDPQKIGKITIKSDFSQNLFSQLFLKSLNS